MAANSWGTPMLVTLMHDPVRPRAVESVEAAVAVIADPYWGDVFSLAYTTARRALDAAQSGSGTAERARWLFLQAADAAGNSVVATLTASRRPQQVLAAG